MVQRAFEVAVEWVKAHPYIAGGVGIFLAGLISGLLL